MPIEIRLDDRSIDELKKWLKERPEKTIKELNDAVRKSIISVEGQAKRNAPVDTGRLRASINREERYLEGEVYTGVRYAIFQEYGTKYFKGRYYMTNAVKMLKAKIITFFEKAIENIIK